MCITAMMAIVYLFGESVPKKEIPVHEVQRYLEEIVYRAGSQRKAAAWLGIGKTQLRTWLGLQRRQKSGRTYTYARHITKESVAHILGTLLKMRRDKVFFDHTHAPGPKPLWLKTNDAEAERKRGYRA